MKVGRKAMGKVCVDEIFGEMTYKHRWYKTEEMEFFGKKWPVTIAAKAYSEKPITEKQRQSYGQYKKDEQRSQTIITEKLIEYINNLEIAGLFIKQKEELQKVVTPRTLLFKQDGTTILLLDCVWDADCGIGIKLYPGFARGIQDLYL